MSTVRRHGLITRKFMYTRVDVSERELEDLIRQHARLIEEGMTFVDHQNKTPGGRLDVLLVDSGKALVVAELKVVEDDGMLTQALDYYDHVSGAVETYARTYQAHGIDPSQPVRMLLVAPSFSQALSNRCKWLNVPISLFSYVCLNFDGKAGLVPVFVEQGIPSQPEPPVVHKQEDRLNYITDDETRARATRTVEQIKSIRPGRTAVDPTKDDISLKVDGKVVAYLSPRRKHFLIYTYDANDKWTPYPIRNDEDVEATLQLTRAYVERRAR
jgi:hypothetical protein